MCPPIFCCSMCVPHFSAVQCVSPTFLLYKVCPPLFCCSKCVPHFSAVQSVSPNFLRYNVCPPLFCCSMCVPHFSAVQCVSPTFLRYNVCPPFFCGTMCVPNFLICGLFRWLAWSMHFRLMNDRSIDVKMGGNTTYKKLLTSRCGHASDSCTVHRLE